MATKQCDTPTPCDLEAEEAVLGAMLLMPQSIDVVLDARLSADDFYFDSHREVFRALLRLYQSGREPDHVTLCDELQSQGALDAVGGRSYVRTLADLVPVASNAAQYAAIVRETSILRSLIRICHETVGECNERSAPAAQLLDKAEGRIYGIARQDESQVLSLDEVLLQTVERVEAMRGEHHHPGRETGLQVLDNYTGGLRPSNLIVVAARPSLGKSALAVKTGLTVAASGAPVLFFSLEMSSEELGDRISSMRCNVRLERFTRGGMSETTRRLLREKATSGLPFYIVDDRNITPLQLRSLARRIAARRGPLGLIVIDYVQLMVGERTRRQENRQQEVSDISRQLKQLAREFDVPVVAVSQLNRQPEMRGGKTPQLSDLRESGALEQDADLVLLLHRERLRDMRTEVIIAKHRNGPTGSVDIAFQHEYTNFVDIARGEV